MVNQHFNLYYRYIQEWSADQRVNEHFPIENNVKFLVLRFSVMHTGAICKMQALLPIIMNLVPSGPLCSHLPIVFPPKSTSQTVHGKDGQISHEGYQSYLALMSVEKMFVIFNATLVTRLLYLELWVDIIIKWLWNF